MHESPQVTRIRHELKRRRLTVLRVERTPPNMVRIVLGGDELHGFTSPGFDDHIKVFFSGTGAPAMRDFTPRYFDVQANELWIDFYLHDAGPAASWAAQAAVGQTLEIGGPKGSALGALEGIDAHVLIGDETALPAINRRLAELPADRKTVLVIELAAGSTRPAFTQRAGLEVIWVPRDAHATTPAHEIISALHAVDLPAGRCFVWVAVETQAARAIRNYLRDERGFDKQWIKAAGYWQRGAAGAHERITDDA